MLPLDEFDRHGIDTRMRLIDLVVEPDEDTDTEKTATTLAGLLDIA